MRTSLLAIAQVLALAGTAGAWGWPQVSPSDTPAPPPGDEAGAPPAPLASEDHGAGPSAPPTSAGSGAADLPLAHDGDAGEPALPAGLDDDAGEPALPAGLDGSEGSATASTTSSGVPLEWRAVLDVRAGGRVIDDPVERTLSLAEARLQLDLAKSWRPWSTVAQLVVDAIGDYPLADRYEPELETGQGAVDLRTASLTVSPTGWLDLRVGRQILTWGTGDLVFINDLFPKDWTAFLIGRADDYLKAPSDAVKLALFTPVIGLDVVATPRFDADRLPARDRLSSWDPALGRLAGADDPLMIDAPDEWIADGELAARLHRSLGSWEIAGYGYRGFWKSPAGMDPSSGAAVFPELDVYGASVRGPALGGLFHLEGGYYDSRRDRDGDDPLIRNSEARGLAGHERQLARDLTFGAQYYVEAMLHHDRYLAALPPGMAAADRLRHVVTSRLTYQAWRQRLALSAFVFASPSDRDGYARVTASYAASDRWTVFAGGNLLVGRDEHTFFGQLANNSNAYGGLRYAY